MRGWFVPPIVIPAALILAFLGYGLLRAACRSHPVTGAAYAAILHSVVLLRAHDLSFRPGALRSFN